MNCPNCDKPPVSGFFPSFQPFQVGIKKAFKGQFKCQHCGTLLQQATKGGLPTYPASYWLYIAVYILLMLGGMLLALYLISIKALSSIVTLVGLGAYIFLLFAAVDSFVKPRYWEIEPVVDSESSESTEVKLTSKGWAIFVTFSVLAIALFAAMPELLSDFRPHIHSLVITGGAVLYSGLVMFGAIYILTTFSEERPQSE